MNTFRKLLVAIIIVATTAGITNAQFQTPQSGGGFTLNFIGALPVGEFAANPPQSGPILLGYPSILTTYGNASMGAGLGFKADYHFDFGLGIFISVDAIWNQLNSTEREKYNQVKKTKPNYINFPIMLGLSYKCYFGNFFGLYAEGGAGLGLMYVTPEGWSDDLTEFRLSNAFAWQAGGGILLGKHISLGVHYNMLGNHSIEIKDPSILQTVVLPARKQKAEVLTFKLGLMF